ncbi:MAG: segregation/condensation protein A [Clostridia bacterium]|nr:segregation/condensation protein A [Clostridia bacterium]
MEEYRISIGAFEGPLDLLLHLVRQAEIDICDIFVSEITAQYLSYMDEVGTLDMDKASAFLEMAANLLYIKSRQLLPKPEPEVTEDGVPVESPEEQLIRQLRDYEAFKEAGAVLEEQYIEMSDSFCRLPEDIPLPPQRIEFKDPSLNQLIKAFRDLMDRAERKKSIDRLHRVRPDAFTIRTQLKTIRSKLKGRKEAISFEELLSEEPEKMEIIVTFMALLEMIAHGEILLRQPAPFEPIRIMEKKLLNGDAGYTYMDEEQENAE